ncbi:NADH-cytochrome B5 reductase [Metarhizium robertsii]|uniref:Cytochrome b5, heme-binding site n=2 Tax=Metarhizium robertsii TaxID=568076 RepID=E9F9A5_METRA|nr:Cytochrome b5, heme-binding site [Metarhizium robertsii ARSEF 23]EFY95710.1 Cytochrome b5, heme-binding site [Metarhizium robertsii ARSEF 23]EXU98052.1 NADH-cytochrome B5 reductase [Metarhizium robertsii]
MEIEAATVAQHNKPEDCWITVHGKVYDVTKYLQDHPGGADVLAEAAGTDATHEFDNAGHSEDAWDIMQPYLVGNLQGHQEKKQKPKPKPIMSQPPSPKPTPSTKGQSLTTLATLGLVSLSIAAIYYLSRHRRPCLPKSLVSWLHSKPENQGGFGFIKGLFISSSIFAVGNAILAQRLAKLIWGTKSFTSYPAHIKAPQRIRKNTLLQHGLLDPSQYRPLPLQTKTLVAPNVYKLTFALPTADTVLGLPIGQHVAIKADVGGESVSRSYTPVSNNSDRGVLELVVKVYPDGKLTSGFLGRLRVGDGVLFRGPKGAMRYRRGLCREIGMVAGGTGITPMFQIIRAVCEDDRDLTRISLVYANRREEDILLREELDRFARRYPDNLTVYYMLDQPPADWAYGRGYVTKELMREKLPAPSADSRIMLCGPPGMVQASKSSLVALGFQQPGAMAKMTDQIFLF